jgi:hypothetical protein
MSRNLSEREQTTLNTIWSGLHENGKSAQAADLAHRELTRLKTPDFDSTQPDIYFVELARQAVVTGTASARKEPLAIRAFPALMHASETIVDAYPLSHNATDAKKRAAFWESSTLNNADHPAGQTLRDTLHTLHALEMMFGNDDYEDLQEGILDAMHEISRRFPNDRFALIGQIEEAELEQAQDAFKVFLERFGPSKDLRPPSGGLKMRYEIELRIPLTQLITVSTRLIGRELREKKLLAAHTHRQQLLANVSLYEQEYRRKMESQYTSGEDSATLSAELARLPKLLAREQFTGVFRPMLDNMRAEQWRKQLKGTHPKALSLDRLKPLQTLSYVGLSTDLALPLSDENR